MTVPSPESMDASQPKDSRLEQAEAKLEQVERGLGSIDSCLEGVPEECREQVRTALREATVVGALLGDLQHASPPPPMDAEGNVLLGKSMREHILRVRELHSKREHLKRGVHRKLAA